MSSIHYKFRSNLEYDTITFDSQTVSLNDLRDAIMAQKKIAKSPDYTLEITNAQSKEVYSNDETLIPKNSSVIVKRVPIQRLAAVTDKSLSKVDDELTEMAFARLTKTADLAGACASEDDKIFAMMSQSGVDFDPSTYLKRAPPNYVCYRCGAKGHYIKNCPTQGDPRYNKLQINRQPSGIPREFYLMKMKQEEELIANLRSMQDENSRFSPVVGSDVVDHSKVPSELQCTMCNKLFTDVVVTPCCGESYCDDCIRNFLIDNDIICKCGVMLSPDNLIANKSLRISVSNYRNQKKTEMKPVPQAAKVALPSTVTPNTGISSHVGTPVTSMNGAPFLNNIITNSPQKLEIPCEVKPVVVNHVEVPRIVASLPHVIARSQAFQHASATAIYTESGVRGYVLPQQQLVTAVQPSMPYGINLPPGSIVRRLVPVPVGPRIGIPSQSVLPFGVHQHVLGGVPLAPKVHEPRKNDQAESPMPLTEDEFYKWQSQIKKRDPRTHRHSPRCRSRSPRHDEKKKRKKRHRDSSQESGSDRREKRSSRHLPDRIRREVDQIESELQFDEELRKLKKKKGKLTQESEEPNDKTTLSRVEEGKPKKKTRIVKKKILRVIKKKVPKKKLIVESEAIAKDEQTFTQDANEGKQQEVVKEELSAMTDVKENAQIPSGEESEVKPLEQETKKEVEEETNTEESEDVTLKDVPDDVPETIDGKYAEEKCKAENSNEDIERKNGDDNVLNWQVEEEGKIDGAEMPVKNFDSGSEESEASSEELEREKYAQLRQKVLKKERLKSTKHRKHDERRPDQAFYKPGDSKLKCISEMSKKRLQQQDGQSKTKIKENEHDVLKSKVTSLNKVITGKKLKVPEEEIAGDRRIVKIDRRIVTKSGEYSGKKEANRSRRDESSSERQHRRRRRVDSSERRRVSSSGKQRHRDSSRSRREEARAEKLLKVLEKEKECFREKEKIAALARARLERKLKVERTLRENLQREREELNEESSSETSSSERRRRKKKRKKSGKKEESVTDASDSYSDDDRRKKKKKKHKKKHRKHKKTKRHKKRSKRRKSKKDSSDSEGAELSEVDNNSEAKNATSSEADLEGKMAESGSPSHKQSNESDLSRHGDDDVELDYNEEDASGVADDEQAINERPSDNDDVIIIADKSDDCAVDELKDDTIRQSKKRKKDEEIIHRKSDDVENKLKKRLISKR